MKRTLSLAAAFSAYLALPLFPRLASAQVSPPQASEVNPRSRAELTALPFVFYLPETKFAVGVGGYFIFRPAGRRASSPPSNVSFSVLYTQLKQFQALVTPQFYFHGEDELLTGSLTFEYYPNKYWGIGDRTPASNETGYSPRHFALVGSFQKRILSSQNLYAGVQYQFETVSIISVGSDAPLDLARVPGGKGGRVSGLGVILNWDTRNNIFIPVHGKYFQLSLFANERFLGSSFDFVEIKGDLRKFFPGLFVGHALALQFLFQSAIGNPPFYRYPMIGGFSVLRGYYMGRYRDKCLVVLQAEYRLPLWWRFGLVGFAGLGNVGPALDKIDLGELKYSAGLGFRFKLLPKEGVNVRVDFAFGKGSTGVYFTTGEAF